MGVRGLSTFIARNADEYFKSYQLHDTWLVIDGNCIACHLYKWHSKCNDCFGGDYDKYANTICKFLSILEECNVKPIVVFDGGYEGRKLKTVYDRMLQRIRLGKNLNSVTEGGVNMFPLFVRDLFKDIVLRRKVTAVKCDFEADYEIACIARTLNCPVLSYDSDFYLFDVGYVPFSTMELQVCKSKDKVKYIPCKIYQIDKFLHSFGGLDRSNLPLLGVLLGNDYIKRSAFKDFYRHIKLAKRKHVRSDQQRRIFAVINWLKNESFESAVNKILGRMKTKKRQLLARRIKKIAMGYICKSSEIMKYLGIAAGDSTSEMNALSSLIDEITDKEPIEELEGASDGEEAETDDEEEFSESDFEAEDVEWLNVTVPEWFLHNFRQCKYPSSFMDMLFSNTYYFTPQAEDYTLPCSHEISLDVVAAIHAVLTSSSSDGLYYLSRHGQNNIKKYHLAPYEHNVPTLNDLYNINLTEKKTLLFQILNIDPSFSAVLDFVPPVWKLYIISVKYWFEKAKPQVLNYHLYALILCGIVVQHCDEKVGFHRSTKKFMQKYEGKLKTVLASAKEEILPHYVEAPLNNITFNDALQCVSILIDYFQLDYRMRATTKLFDISIVHAFAQFQSCLLHINHLNLLLDCPFESTVISDFYDGTFVYNACMNFSKRSCVETYLKSLLKNCPFVLTSLLLMVKKLDGVLNVSSRVNTSMKKRRRKRNKKKNGEQKEECNSNKDDSSDCEIFDENNRFSVLSKNKCVT